MQQNKPTSLLLPIIFAMLWASTYATARIGLDYISPLFFVALRLTIAAALMLGFVITAMRNEFPSASSVPHLLIGGGLVHGVTLTSAHVALITVQAAPLALVHAFHPVLTAALAFVLLKEGFTARQWCGMGLGMVGVVLAFPFATTQWSVIGLVVLSLAGLTGGTLYLKHFTSDATAFPSTAVQLAGGACASIIAMVLFETPHVTWTPPLIAVMLWSIFMVSIAAMSMYSVMLMRGQAGRAASAFFIAPGAAALIAWVLLGQTLNLITLIGLVLASFGVWLVWRRAKK